MCRVESWLIRKLNQSKIYVLIRKSAVGFAEFWYGVLASVTESTEEPSPLNPLALFMKKLLMYPAQVPSV